MSFFKSCRETLLMSFFKSCRMSDALFMSFCKTSCTMSEALFVSLCKTFCRMSDALFVLFCKTYRMSFVEAVFVSFLSTIVTTWRMLKAFTPSKRPSMFSTGGISTPSMDAGVLARVCEGDVTFGRCALHFYFGLHPSKPPKCLKQERKTNIVNEHAHGI